MTDDELHQQFREGTLEAKLFTHATHVKMGWIYLNKFEFTDALSGFSQDLKHFAKAKGASKLYNETITFAFLVIINERMQRTVNQQIWENFVEKNPDLFDWKNNILKKYYKSETLRSEFAKKHFVFPDKYETANV